MIIRQDNYGNVSVVEDDKYQYGVMNNAGEMVVPFEKYGWISGFDYGLARVKNHDWDMVQDFPSGEIIEKAKWGIIDESGQEVLPVIYDEVWNFFNKGMGYTKVVFNGREKLFNLISRQLTIGYNHTGYHSRRESSYMDDYNVLEDAFEGDPENYWNID